MKDDFDVEKSLKHFRCDPGESVRESVLSEFDRQAAAAKSVSGQFRLWQRPVPAYVVAALLLLFVTGAFVAGRQSADIPENLSVMEDTVSGPEMAAAENIPWFVTAKDHL